MVRMVDHEVVARVSSVHGQSMDAHPVAEAKAEAEAEWAEAFKAAAAGRRDDKERWDRVPPHCRERASTSRREVEWASSHFEDAEVPQF